VVKVNKSIIINGIRNERKLPKRSLKVANIRANHNGTICPNNTPRIIAITIRPSNGILESFMCLYINTMYSLRLEAKLLNKVST
jgi:hypothetical protein